MYLNVKNKIYRENEDLKSRNVNTIIRFEIKLQQKIYEWGL